MSESIFTKIINREIPASIVYEDDLVVAFLDANPVHKGHTLVVPKEPFENIYDGNADILGHMMVIAQKISRAVTEAVGADGVNLIMNNKEAADQEVFHAHLHVIPRFANDNAYTTNLHETYEEGEDLTVATQIQAALGE